MLNLYPLHEMYHGIENALIASEGEITPEIEEMFEKSSVMRSDKLVALACMVKNAKAEVAAFKAEITRLDGMKDRAEKSIEKLEEMAKQILPTNESWSNELHKISYRPSARVDVVNIADVPAEYFRIVPETKEVDKAKATATFKQADVLSDDQPHIPGLQYVKRFSLQVK